MGIRRLNTGVGKDGGEDFVVDKAGEAVGHGVVLEAAFAFLAVIAAVLDGDGDERGKLALRVFGHGKVV